VWQRDTNVFEELAATTVSTAVHNTPGDHDRNMHCHKNQKPHMLHKVTVTENNTKMGNSLKDIWIGYMYKL